MRAWGLKGVHTAGDGGQACLACPIALFSVGIPKVIVLAWRPGRHTVFPWRHPTLGPHISSAVKMSVQMMGQFGSRLLSIIWSPLHFYYHTSPGSALQPWKGTKCWLFPPHIAILSQSL
eukprot:7243187-Ditylum_brightwellii.AAC.1